MRAIQFWILLAMSFIVSGLMLKEIQLNRQLVRKQAALSDSQDVVSTGPAYENAWKQIAVRIYRSAPTDPALQKILKDEKIEIHPAASPGETSAQTDTGGMPSTPVSTNSVIPTPPRIQVPPVHP